MRNASLWISATVVLAVLVIGAAFLLRSHLIRTPISPTSSTTSAAAASTTTYELGNGITATGPAGAKIEIVNDTIAPPSLKGSISISASLPQDAQTQLRSAEEALISQLKSDPKRVDLWLELGIDRKIAGDYQGAAAAWQYVAQTGPNSINYVAYGDLGDLYMNFLHDYAKAEANYKIAIAINPQFVDYYSDLFVLYTSFYKTNTSAAADIVAQGLKANPNNPTLLKLQQQLNVH